MIRHHHRIAPAIALTLALVFAAPALARPELNRVAGTAHASRASVTSVCSEPCWRRGYAPVLPAAGAALAHDPRARSVALSSGGWGMANAITSRPSTAPRGGSPASSVVRPGGFHWGDAGIGAGAFSLLIGGLLLCTASFRRRAIRGSAQPTT